MTGALGAGYPRWVEKHGGEVRFAGVADGCVAVGIFAYYHAFGQWQRQAEVHLAVVQNVGFELNALGGLIQVFKQIGLIHLQPPKHRQHHAVGMAGEVSEDDLQIKAVLKGQTDGGGAADFAVVDENQQSVGVVLEFANGGEQMSAQTFRFVHGV